MVPRKKFKSPDNTNRRVMHPSGIHSAIVGEDWTYLPEHLWVPAYMAGCISEDILTRDITEEQGLALVNAERHKFERLVEKAMKEILEEADPENIDKYGKPKIAAINKKVGQPVQSHLKEKIWYKIGKQLNV